MHVRRAVLLPAFLMTIILLPAGPALAETWTCTPDSAPDNTGSVYGPTPLDSEIVAWRSPIGASLAVHHEVGYARFNTTPVEPALDIATVTLHYYVNTTTGHARYIPGRDLLLLDGAGDHGRPGGLHLPHLGTAAHHGHPGRGRLRPGRPGHRPRLAGGDLPWVEDAGGVRRLSNRPPGFRAVNPGCRSGCKNRRSSHAG